MTQRPLAEYKLSSGSPRPSYHICNITNGEGPNGLGRVRLLLWATESVVKEIVVLHETRVEQCVYISGLYLLKNTNKREFVQFWIILD